MRSVDSGGGLTARAREGERADLLIAERQPLSVELGLVDLTRSSVIVENKGVAVPLVGALELFARVLLDVVDRRFIAAARREIDLNLDPAIVGIVLISHEG